MNSDLPIGSIYSAYMQNAVTTSIASVALFVLFTASTGAIAQSQTFNFEQGVSAYVGFEDTTIFSESDNSGGATTGIFSGTILNLDFGGDTQTRRALVQADISAIPTDWIVENVSFTLTVRTSGGTFGNIDYSLHPILGDWVQGSVVGSSSGGFGAPADDGDPTWNSRLHNSVLWAAPGGDFDPATSATAPAGLADTEVTWSTAQMINDVQQWVSSPTSNHGWIIISALEGTRQRVKNFYSSESPGSRPRLQIIARPPPISMPINTLVSFVAIVALIVFGIRRITTN